MTIISPADADRMLRQRGYPDGDRLGHLIQRGMAGVDVAVELALLMRADAEIDHEQGSSPAFVARRGPGRPRKVEA